MQLFAAASAGRRSRSCCSTPAATIPSRNARRARRAGGGFRGFSRQTEEDHSLLIANATLSGQLAADGDAGDHSPFAKSLLKSFDDNPATFLRDLLEMTAKDVRVASAARRCPR